MDPDLKKLLQYYVAHPEIMTASYSCGLAIPINLDEDTRKQTFLDLASKITFYLEDTVYAERIVPVRITEVDFSLNFSKHFVTVQYTHNGKIVKDRNPDLLYASPRAYWRAVVRKTTNNIHRFLDASSRTDALEWQGEQDWMRKLLDLSDEIHRNVVIPFQCHSEHLLPEKKETDS